MNSISERPDAAALAAFRQWLDTQTQAWSDEVKATAYDDWRWCCSARVKELQHVLAEFDRRFPKPKER